MTFYNMTTILGSHNALGLVQGANLFTGGQFGTMLYVVIFIIMLVRLKGWDFKQGWLVTCFTMGIFGMLLAFADLIDISGPIIVWIIFAISALFTWASD